MMNQEVMDEIPNTLGYGRVLPNLQLICELRFLKGRYIAFARRASALQGRAF